MRRRARAWRSRPHEGREERAEATPEIIREALPGRADAGWEQLGEEWPDAAEHARGEEAERKAQQQHHRVGDRQISVEQRDHEGATREDKKVHPPAEMVGKICARIADERSDDDDGEIAAGAEDGELALGAQEGRQPGRDGVVAALRPGREQRGQARLFKIAGLKISRTFTRSPVSACRRFASRYTGGSSTKQRM